MTTRRLNILSAHCHTYYEDPHTGTLWALEHFTLNGAYGATWVNVSAMTASAFRGWLGY